MDYLASLRRLASRCQFGAFPAEALRDRLVCGLLSENIQKVLLTKAELTLKKALETAQDMEAAAQKSKELKGSHRSNAMLAVDKPGRICDSCHRGNHDKRDCKFKGAIHDTIVERWDTLHLCVDQSLRGDRPRALQEKQSG